MTAVTQSLQGTELQPHAAAVLLPALPPSGRPSHAYLFHGPRGSGKRAVARAFATALLADGSPDAASGGSMAGAGGPAASGAGTDAVAAIAERVARGSHPDLTWVRPSGASEMLVSDVAEPVVAAASRTPFEGKRRVFVIEGADLMGDRPANMMLKTLEEPPDFAHLLLLADRREDVLPTIVSRCQAVRFDPLPPAAIEAKLLAREGGVEGGPEVAAACSRLALGDAELAESLASEGGSRMRAAARDLAVAALHGGAVATGSSEGGRTPWAGLLAAARQAGSEAGARVLEGVQEEVELLPVKERKRREREAGEAAKRAERRERTAALDLGLRLLELWLRDVLCAGEGALELVHARDELDALRADAQKLAATRGASSLRRAIELVCDTRLRLAQNVSEELALQALSHRLRAVLGDG